MAAKGTLPSTLKMILKTRYPLSCAESESSEDYHTENKFLEEQADGQEEERSPSPLPWAEPESSGDDQIESFSVEALADGREEGEIGDAARRTARRHDGETSEAKEIVLIRAQILGGEGKVVPKRECPALEST